MNEFDSLQSAQVVHNSAAQQFELHVGEKLCLLQYRIANGKIVIFHTEVPETIQNRGLAERMTETALDFARAQNLKVDPRCPYTAAYLRKHREYSDLL
jgi:predicted GNAT family acetyltransferase